MNFEEINILELLPQHPPFVMVDKLLYCDAKTTKTTFTVREDNIFFQDGLLIEAGLIENIAQTCAARVRNVSGIREEKSAKIGFIGSISNMEIVRLPKIGEALLTQVIWMEEVFQISLVSATVSVNNEIITSCEMKISLTDIKL